MKPLISLCMIVKDEEHYLARCLDSVKEIVDEIIIIDTGSSDNTVKIGESYTEHVYHFQWINDFAAARNESIKHANGKWILVMDADEYMEPTEGLKLREFLQKLKPERHTIYAVTVTSFLGKGGETGTNEVLVSRVFPNHCGIHYHRPIHEQLQSKYGVKLRSTTAPCRILHSGYEEETIAAKQKFQRNLEIFEQYKDKKGGYSVYDCLMLGNQYNMMKDYDQASFYLHKALEGKQVLGDSYKQVLFSLLQTYLGTKRYIDAWIFMDQHLKTYEQYSDILAIRGLLCYYLGFNEEAKLTFQQCLSIGEELASSGQTFAIVSPAMGTRLPLLQLSTLFEQKKDFHQTIYYLTKVLGAFMDGSALSRLIHILSLHDSAPSIITFLDKLVDTTNPVTIPLLCKISISLGYVELSKHYVQRLPSLRLLKLAERLRYSLMLQNQIEFQHVWEEGSKEEKRDPQVIFQLVLAAVSWNHPSWIDWMPLHDADHAAYLDWGRSLLTAGRTDILETDPNYAFQLVSGLYMIGHLERFDQLLEGISTAVVLNRIANFLYTMHHDDAALQCYTYLNESGLLDDTSCSNLSDVYLRMGDTETALLYLEQAIQLNPQERKRYIRYCTLCSDPLRRAGMKQQLLQLDPNYQDLPPFLAL